LFVTVTVALGIAAPLASLTWPTIALVVSPWEKAASGKRARNNPTKINIESVERSIVVSRVLFIWTVCIINLT
jgi:hypothetical protein